MLTGSMASNYWGIPRTTHGIDFVIQLPPSEAATLAMAFSGEYFLDEASIRAAYRPPFQFNAIDTRSALKIDFWLLRPDPFEREMFSRRTEVTLFGEKAWISTAEDVILHKLYWNTITPSERQLKDARGNRRCARRRVGPCLPANASCTVARHRNSRAFARWRNQAEKHLNSISLCGAQFTLH